MTAVHGIYEGGNTVRIDDAELDVLELGEVVITSLRYAKEAEAEHENISPQKERTTHWLDHPWKATPGWKPLTREEIYDRK